MALMNTKTQYGSVAKWLHWLIGLGIIGLLFVGFFMDDIQKGSDLRGLVYNAHKVTGVTILALVCLRFIWKLINKKPELPNKPSLLESFAEHTVQWCFYLVMFAMPLSGWAMATAAGYYPHVFGMKLMMPFIEKSKSLAECASQVHEFVAWSIVVLLVLHIGAALVHPIIKKDNVLTRMMPGGK